VFEVKIEKPLELNLHANSVVSMNILNTVIANAIEKSKLGEAGFVKYDIFSSPALVEKVCSDDILSPLYDVPSYDDMFDEYALRNSCSLACANICVYLSIAFFLSSFDHGTFGEVATVVYAIYVVVLC
jgi:hypothetical protein